jgi:hypothetical protein
VSGTPILGGAGRGGLCSEVTKSMPGPLAHVPEASGPPRHWEGSRASSLGLCPGLTMRALPKAKATQKPPPTTKDRQGWRCWPGQREAQGMLGLKPLPAGVRTQTLWEGAWEWLSVKRGRVPAPRVACPDHSSHRSQGCFVSLWGFPGNSQK